MDEKESVPLIEAGNKSRSGYIPKDERLGKLVKRLSQLESYKNSSESDIRQAAQDILDLKETEDEMDIGLLFKLKEEKQAALQLLKKYLQDYTIETISDRNTLKNLIYLEVLNFRLQERLNDIHSETKASPKDIVKTIHENIEQITELKEKLGITRQKEQELHQNKNPLAYINLLMKKRKKWLEDNQASRYMSCPHCGKSTLLKIKMDIWEAQKHPFFKDRILGNDHLVELYRQGKLNKKDLALIFETSEDYVDWLVTKWNLTSVSPEPEKKSSNNEIILESAKDTPKEDDNNAKDIKESS